ncbi:MAG: hypothetical protein EZS28_030612 [Streblomastix strix]|uniref:Uncharacterized protein n=1 Tax=Streblomastix strix TaxID=222440 RepID=A0A5J4UVH3_9EUKA|nr:MAG: hypothetical protein EZS28_030612 [Streblomastix strix]
MVVDMSTGAFYEFPGKYQNLKDFNAGQPEDFQYYPQSINTVAHVPYQSYTPYHSLDDRFVLGVGNGRSGALHYVGLGRSLKKIMQGKWYEELPTLFTSRAYAGSPLHSLLLVEEEKTIEINNEQSEKNKDVDDKRTLINNTISSNTYSCLLKDRNNFRNSYCTTVYILHEDAIQPVDSKDIGIDNLKKTLTLGSANGAVVQVTTSDIHVIPTLRFFAHQSNQDEQSQQQGSNTLSTIINPQSQQQIPKNIYQKGLIIRSEFIGYNAQHSISWSAPSLLSEEFCQQRISDFQQKHSNINSQKSQIVQSEQISSFQYAEQSQQLTFECACVSDNMIAVSYKCIVFVLVWNPSRPQIVSNSSNPAKSSDNQQSCTQIPAILHPVSTLCFPSPVKTLTASTICSRSFLVVGCESPPSVFLFRLDTPQIAQQTINSHNKLWDDGEKLLNDLKYQIAYPTVLRPDPSLQYMRNDGAVVIIAGHNGQLATAITPLSAILDFPPTEYDQKLYPQTVRMAEDDGIIYIYGDRGYVLTWCNNACKFIWTDLEYSSIIHSFVPMRVVDEQPSLQFLQDDNLNKGNDKIDLEKQSFNTNTEDTTKTQIPHPTVAWIDFTDQKLTFGTIDKRRIITRQIKDLPSLPLAVAHVPTMHAIAVLCREHSNYPYYEQTQEQINNSNLNGIFQTIGCFWYFKFKPVDVYAIS